MIYVRLTPQTRFSSREWLNCRNLHMCLWVSCITNSIGQGDKHDHCGCCLAPRWLKHELSHWLFVAFTFRSSFIMGWSMFLRHGLECTHNIGLSDRSFWTTTQDTTRKMRCSRRTLRLRRCRSHLGAISPLLHHAYVDNVTSSNSFLWHAWVRSAHLRLCEVANYRDAEITRRLSCNQHPNGVYNALR